MVKTRVSLVRVGIEQVCEEVQQGLAFFDGDRKATRPQLRDTKTISATPTIQNLRKMKHPLKR